MLTDWKGSPPDLPKPLCYVINIYQVFKDLKCSIWKDKACFSINEINLLWTWMAVLTLWDHLFFAVREKIFWSKRLPFYISDQLK